MELLWKIVNQTWMWATVLCKCIIMQQDKFEGKTAPPWLYVEKKTDVKKTVVLTASDFPVLVLT